MLNFQDEDQLHPKCLFHILIIYRKYLAFQLLNRGTRMEFPILTDV